MTSFRFSDNGSPGRMGLVFMGYCGALFWDKFSIRYEMWGGGSEVGCPAETFIAVSVLPSLFYSPQGLGYFNISTTSSK